MRKNKAIVLKDLNTRLSIPIDQNIVLSLPHFDKEKKVYYLDRIKELEDTNQKLKDALNSLSNKRDELKYLKEFRNIFTGHCIIHNVKKTVIQCTETIRKGNCNFYNECNERKKWNKLIIF